MGKRNIDQIGRHKNERLTKKSPQVLARGDFRRCRQNRSYFKTINVNG
jgi:hypothetical protein